MPAWRAGSGVGNEGCYLADEVFEVAQGLEPVDDDFVVDPGVIVDQDVAEANRLADGARQRRTRSSSTTVLP
jgi:hypothetical protein